MAEKMPSAADRRYTKPSADKEEKPGQDGKREKPEPKAEPKKDSGTSASVAAHARKGEGGGMEMMKQHAHERMMLAEHHEKERRDLHGQHREEHRRMREKHEGEMTEAHAA